MLSKAWVVCATFLVPRSRCSHVRYRKTGGRHNGVGRARYVPKADAFVISDVVMRRDNRECPGEDGTEVRPLDQLGRKCVGDAWKNQGRLALRRRPPAGAGCSCGTLWCVTSIRFPWPERDEVPHHNTTEL